MGKFKSKKNRNEPFLRQLTEDNTVRTSARQKDSRNGVVTEETRSEVRTSLGVIVMLSFRLYASNQVMNRGIHSQRLI